MELYDKIKRLYEKATAEAYANLLELEKICEEQNTLYPYADEIITLLKSEKYAIRIRGLRLTCRLAKWDTEHKIDDAIDILLALLQDEKPTVVRQTLQYLIYLVPYKKELHVLIKNAVLTMECMNLKDTMKPLIEKDMKNLLSYIDSL